jgi:hypothetical protein
LPILGRKNWHFTQKPTNVMITFLEKLDVV